jgi:hypothetical protein
MGTYSELFEQFKKLSTSDQQRLIDDARQYVKSRNILGLHYGAKVQFRHSKTRAVIPGTFIRMRTKYAEVMSDYNQNGVKQPTPVRWSVSPEVLTPLTPEQARMAESHPPFAHQVTEAGGTDL